MKGICSLCEAHTDLQLSHVVPAFVLKWLKKDGHIRHAQNIDRRVQDGAKIYLLCRNCEQRFNRYETEFAKQIFHPISANDGLTIKYDHTLLKFCASISWRSLKYLMTVARLSHFSEHQRWMAHQALEVWRGFLLEKLPNPGVHEQHLIQFSTIETAGNFEFPPNINRYLTRAVELDVGCNSDSAFVYSKFGRFALFGFIDVKNPKEWQGTKIHVRAGTLGPRVFTLPYELGEYLSSRAAKAWEKMKTISETQQEKVDETIRANLDRFAKSDHFRALQRDVEMFGRDAFSKKK